MELSDKEPWDTMKAQLLKEISDALTPQVLDFSNYACMFFIPRVLPKPGMVLATEDNYAALLLRAKNLTSKTPTINLTILEKKRHGDKENIAVPAEAQAETKVAKKVIFHFQLITHILDQYNRRRNPRSFQETSTERLIFRSCRTVGCAFSGSQVHALAPTAIFFRTPVITTRSIMKGWSVGHQRW